MNSTIQILVVALVALLTGAFLGAIVSWLFNHAQKLSARAAADQCISERDRQITTLQTSVQQARADAERELAELNEQLRKAAEAKGVAVGTVESLNTLKAELEGKVRALDTQTTRANELSIELAKARSQAQEAESNKAAAISAKDAEAERLILSAHEACEQQVHDLKDAHARLVEQKEASLEEQLRLVRKHCAEQIAEKDRAVEEQKRLLAEAETKLAATFESAGMKALKSATDEFLKLASARFDTTQEQADGQFKARQKAIEEMMKPVQTCLASLEEQCGEMERKRQSAYEAVNGQIERLMHETGQLSNALRRPTARGNWGELTLRTVAENAGLVEGQDYELQHSSDTDDGKLRADMVVRLPNKRAIVIDSKTPLDSYREAVNCEDGEQRQANLANHARLVRSHIQQLGSKGYQGQYEGADYVLMFLPAESIYQAAIEFDSGLIEYAMKNRVLLANPMTLIGLLKAVAYVLDQERLNQDALAVSAIGKNLYEGIQSYAGHVAQLGKHLSRSVETYNRSVGSLERMVLSRARTLRAKGIGTGVLSEIADVETLPITFRSPELSALNADGEPSLNSGLVLTPQKQESVN